MTKLSAIARHRRAAALSALAGPGESNVIHVDFRAPRIRPVLPPDLGMRPAALRSAPTVTALPLAA